MTALLLGGFGAGMARAEGDANAAALTVIKLCDTLAADPGDSGKPAGIAGVALEKLDAATAIAACEAAASLAADVPRVSYNLGRALVASGNFIDAIVPLRAASDAGYGAADRVIGDMYAKGQGFSADPAKAEEFYAKAAAAGDTSATLRNVDALLATGTPADHKQALDLLRAAADEGNPGAQFRVAIELAARKDDYFYGEKADLIVAERYLKGAAAAQWPGAQNELIRLHLYGGPFDREAAISELLAAAEGGDPWAMTELADLAAIWDVGPYAKLDTTAQFDVANDWLKKAAALDYPDAIFKLAANYGWGAGTLERDQAKSESLYKRAAEMGHPGAAGRYGFVLYRTANTEAEYAEAARYLMAARDGGANDGALGLGHLYLHGDGVPHDIDLAIENYSLALEDGYRGVAAYQLARIYDREPGYVDPVEAADYLIRGIDLPDGPDTEAEAGFKEFSRDTRVALQQELIKRGLLQGKADGAFGPASLAAYLKTADWRQ